MFLNIIFFISPPACYNLPIFVPSIMEKKKKKPKMLFPQIYLCFDDILL